VIQIDVRTRRQITVSTSVREAFELLRDCESVARSMPDVDRIESLGERRYRCVLTPMRTLGIEFIGDLRLRVLGQRSRRD